MRNPAEFANSDELEVPITEELTAEELEEVYNG